MPSITPPLLSFPRPIISLASFKSAFLGSCHQSHRHYFHFQDPSFPWPASNRRFWVHAINHTATTFISKTHHFLGQLQIGVSGFMPSITPPLLSFPRPIISLASFKSASSEAFCNLSFSASFPSGVLNSSAAACCANFSSL